MIAAVAIIAALFGGGFVFAVERHAARVALESERFAHAREIARVENLLLTESGRTADLLTRLQSRSATEYRNVTEPAPIDTSPPRAYVTDATGLLVADADDESNVVEV